MENSGNNKNKDNRNNYNKTKNISITNILVKCSSFAGDWNGRHLEAVRAPAHLGKLEMSLGFG